MSDLSIEARSLSKHYGQLIAVDQLSFEVGAGEVLGFLGPNGAGKSTTMKMLTGFLPPTAGSALVNGHDIVENSLAARRCMGYLPEGAPAYGEMPVRAFLEFVARSRGFDGKSAVREADAAIDRLNLSSVPEQPIETLSKGFKRRVGLAQAILHDPRVLILDEPTDGLDPNQKHEVRDLIRDMSSDKIIIISTHILEEVHALCNRAMIIADGRLLVDDTPDGLIARSRYHEAVTLVVEHPEQVASALSELPQARKVELREGELTVFPREGAKLLEVITDAVRENAWAVSELRLEAGRLDEVFRQVTQGEMS
ncbi:MAG: ATP-binding cassette domain-containing protein [Xanthomonadales bacterium]|nr:ATP-binding cassette domain-containing protein [Gammaproteobacteria bacterium]MBT8050736.1 ATP-binding cassette domain-containing protein [Gammaproteobacteria bacterium]MBT8056273.1 ATP-binding cassette domain-containing protein [Gammaproteobacteria bacterium]NNJ78225.1 ATP-binding cassette domain-containing protein [Xanthomonadales bacterium]NNL06046.1 ATP-binding cassette domain-containing protein [Xanthomonadales bacterium]